MFVAAMLSVVEKSPDDAWGDNALDEELSII
jgi:hypothetical protein